MRVRHNGGNTQFWQAFGRQWLQNVIYYGTQETVGSWLVALRHVVHQRDLRRFSELHEFLFVMLGEAFARNDKDSAASDKTKIVTSLTQAKVLRFLQPLLAEYSWRGDAFSKELVDRLVVKHSLLFHPYNQVREEVANIVSFVFHGLYARQAKSLVPLFAQLNIATYEGDGDADAAELRKTEVLLQWWYFSLKSGFYAGITQSWPEIVFKTFALYTESNREVASKAKLCAGLLAQVVVRDEQILTNLIVALQKVCSSFGNTWQVRAAVAPFIQIVVFNHRFFMSDQTSADFIAIVQGLMTDEQVEVRKLAAGSLASILKTAKGDRIEAVIQECSAGLESTQSTKTENKHKRHGYVLGLISVVEAYPYSVPDWEPAVLMQLAEYESEAGPIADSIKSAFAEFWRTHQALWEVEFGPKFTQDQVDILKRVGRTKSYYT
eukprot:TRINITY_DN1479_c0_g1_i2.p1 TRINITY_DN1479_c0_g1~~TRINITY_DN1479_c0_g1_i2.p1  ORF type:complete len:436 (+),score=60.94 TRINITY_DN1479_c0_g1_i2:560-1867(+)